MKQSCGRHYWLDGYCRLNMLFRDRRVHVRTARLMETEARMSREAWGRSMDASDLARAEVMLLRTTVLAQQSQIRELQSETIETNVDYRDAAADHKSQRAKGSVRTPSRTLKTNNNNKQEARKLAGHDTAGSGENFDAIIGMDWLVKYQAIIVCAEKIVRIPWGNETLIVHGDGSNRGHEARLHIISYTKTQEYMLKGCPIFLAHVTTKGTEDKSKEKRLEDVPIV
ncbi:hypothetical protein Tco_0064633 [Tanacetum coccineum]